MVELSFFRTLSIVAILLLALLRTQGQAATVSTPASRITSGVAFALTRIQEQHGQKKSVEIQDLGAFLNLDRMNEEAQGSLESRITLFGDRGPVQGQELILAITSDQISEDRRASIGRYVVWGKGDAIDVRWESEETVSAIFAQSKIALPNKGVWKQPDTRAIYEWGTKPPMGDKPKPPTLGPPEVTTPVTQSVPQPQGKQSPKLTPPTVLSSERGWDKWGQARNLDR